MRKLQNISLVAISILGLSTIKISNVDALTSNIQIVKNTVELAQKPATSTDESSPQTDDEMIDALQNRQEKLKNLNKLQKL